MPVCADKSSATPLETATIASAELRAQRLHRGIKRYLSPDVFATTLDIVLCSVATIFVFLRAMARAITAAALQCVMAAIIRSGSLALRYLTNLGTLLIMWSDSRSNTGMRPSRNL